MEYFNTIEDFYCQKVLPTVYSESLSYYEVLCELQHAINSVIDNQNIIDDYFKVFKNFIDTKIEEYTNEKLNEWMEDGTIDNIINVTKYNELKAELEAEILQVNNVLSTRITSLESWKTLTDNTLHYVGVERITPEVNDNNAIQRAIAKCISIGGGSIRWSGTLEITTPITISSNLVSIDALGETSIIQAKTLMPYVLNLKGTTLYGLKGTFFNNFKIDCNNLANNGLILGNGIPVVESAFSNIQIFRSLDYGLVVDAMQNSYLTNVNINECKGALKIVNGAGNNVFDKCEMSCVNSTLDKVFIGKDSNYLCYNLNIFNNRPQHNILINPVMERGITPTCLNIDDGVNNIVINGEFSSQLVESNAILFGASASYNIISGRSNHGNKTTIPVKNNGFRNTIKDFYIENNDAPYFAETGNVLIVNNCFSASGDIKVNNTTGNASTNLVVDRNAKYDNSTTPVLYNGQFLFNNKNEIKFQNNTEFQNILTGDVISLKETQTVASSTISLSTTLPNGMYDLYITLRNTVYTEILESVNYVGFRNVHMHFTQEVANLKKPSSLLSLNVLSLSDTGVLTITGNASTPQIMVLEIKAIKRHIF